MDRLAETESALAVTDRLWRAEMRGFLGRMQFCSTASAPSGRVNPARGCVRPTRRDGVRSRPGGV